MSRAAIPTFAVGLIAVVAVVVAAYQAEVVFAPLTLALFIIALVWPIQTALQRRVPAPAALGITMTATIAVVLMFAALLVWGFGRVGRSVVTDFGRYQALYDSFVTWLGGHGISVAGLWAQHFNVVWMLRWAHQITFRVNTTLSFWLIALVYVLLGLMEVEDLRGRAETYLEPGSARTLISATADVAYQFRRYMVVRTLMSVATGVLVAAFAWIVGLHFAAEWGLITFALNYLPFIGPAIAVLFPTLLALAQFGTWEALLGVLVCLTIIQFVVGNYVEPLVAGNVLAISPTLVLFAVLFWTFLWGLYGAFIGVPIAIAALTFCRYYSPTQGIAGLFGGPLGKRSTAYREPV